MYSLNSWESNHKDGPTGHKNNYTQKQSNISHTIFGIAMNDDKTIIIS